MTENKLHLKPVTCYDISYRGANIGRFQVESEWKGMSALRNVSEKQSLETLIIATPQGIEVSFGLALNSDIEALLISASPSLLHTLNGLDILRNIVPATNESENTQ